jgi:hypothetical protein
MRLERALLRAGEYLVRLASSRLPPEIRADRYREWTAELPAILHDPQITLAPRRGFRMLGYAADTLRGTALTPGSAWGLRSPAVLMTAYVVVFVLAGPWIAAGPAARRNIPEVLIAIVLGIFAAFGIRAARILMITYSTLGIPIAIFGSTHGPESPWPRLLYVGCYTLQIALLVSTPMYQRTRPGRMRGRWPGPWLPVPRVSTLLLSAGAGLGITLLDIENLHALPCPAHAGALARTACLSDGTGYPVPYRWSGGYIQLYGNQSDVRFLNVAAPGGLQAAAFATDWALWSLVILLVLYLVWLNHHREYSVQPRQRGWQ